METIAVARHAMATRFEIVLNGEDPAALRAAGEEALDEIQRIEAQLSLYQPTSEIAHLNARAAQEPVRVTPSLFKLLKQARELSVETKGAFDITIAPLIRCWGFMGGTGRVPGAEELAEARANVGMDLVELNPKDFTVRFARKGVMLDLGAMGKGYAVERAADLIRDMGISSALVNGGTSSILALGSPPESESWKVAVQGPALSTDVAASPFATISLKDEALSVSAVWGKSFQSEGGSFGHVLDPRCGRPVKSALLAAVALPSATETDVFSTALLVGTKETYDYLLRIRPQARAACILASNELDHEQVISHGFDLLKFM
ncbi:FAD:protein FMN transferase [Pedosphaera parvula]|uniref:FAD:protein FMN transferase n=1 Tax=Pedosphaera parvula (strain Ellin514) TaxID=320771 RepID=B9XF13_PEDPL|nr:FAD:protein FMN transferase [Pedosphaera parvula]EEF61511.1 ApbE family lipoprotein [Pedosphaera parvula Ellin514]